MVTADSGMTSFLSELTKFPSKKLSPKDERAVSFDKVQWISTQLVRHRFRRGVLHQNTFQDVTKKVARSVEESEPIYLVLGFGGYKHFWNVSHPQIDFAELFNISFMMNVVAPIVSLYPPGVTIDYESDDAVVTLIDNYPREALEEYASSFRELISWYNKVAKLPTNIKISLVRPQEQEEYRRLDYENKLIAGIINLRQKKAEEWSTLSKEEQALRLQRTRKSIMWKGEKDLSNLSESERDRMINQSKMDNEIYYEVDNEFREDYFVGGTHIPVVFSWGLCYENTGNWLTYASTFASTVDFWIGRGLAKETNERLIPVILSHSQYDAVKSLTVSVGDLPWKSSPPTTLKNLNNIEIIKENHNVPS